MTTEVASKEAIAASTIARFLLLRSLLRLGKKPKSLYQAPSPKVRALALVIRTWKMHERSHTAVSKPSFADKVKEKQKTSSWADLCEFDSDDDEAILKEMNALSNPKESDKSLKGIYLPKNMKEAMPRWYSIIALACKFCKTDLHSSNFKIEQVALPNIYSLDEGEWEAAKQSARQNSKDTYAAYNTISQVLTFFSKPIDLDKNPTLGLGQTWVLNKICFDWFKETYGDDFDAEAFKIGTTGYGMRNVIVEKLKSLFERGDSTELAEEITSALEHLIYKYIKRIYNKPGATASAYIKQAIQSITRDGSKLLSCYMRKIVVKTRETEGKGKQAKIVEKSKISFVKPWIHKGDELWTAEEKKALKIINEFMTALPDWLDQRVNSGPVFDGRAAESLIAQAWEITDDFNSIAKKRKRKIRAIAVSNKADDKKSEKITPNEWNTAKATVLSDKEIGRDLQTFVMVQGGEDGEPLMRDHLQECFELKLEDITQQYRRLKLDWTIFEAGKFQPEEYHRIFELKEREERIRAAQIDEKLDIEEVDPE